MKIGKIGIFISGVTAGVLGCAVFLPKAKEKIKVINRKIYTRKRKTNVDESEDKILRG